MVSIQLMKNVLNVAVVHGSATVPRMTSVLTVKPHQDVNDVTEAVFVTSFMGLLVCYVYVLLCERSYTVCNSAHCADLHGV